MTPMAAVFEALASPRRREILRLVWDRERSAGDIHRALPDISFGAVSQHLGVLESAGLVARREEGRFHYYAARRKELGHLGKWLETMWDEALSDLKRHAESEEKRRGRRRGPRRLSEHSARSESIVARSRRLLGRAPGR
jgi:Bacterial regulatory protein, arsR family.